MQAGFSHATLMLLTDQPGALLNFEAAARLEAFRGDLDSARRVFRAGAERCPPSARFLREWGAFEKRAGSLDVRALGT
jgi:hypothetical protein